MIYMEAFNLQKFILQVKLIKILNPLLQTKIVVQVKVMCTQKVFKLFLNPKIILKI